MIKIEIAKDKYSIPSVVSELKYNQWIEIQDEKDELKVLSVLTTIPVYILKQLSEQSIQTLVSIVSYIKKPIDFDQYTTDKAKDIKTKTYGQKIVFHQSMKDNPDNIIELIPKILSIYDQDDFDEKHEIKTDELLLIDSYTLAANYVNQLVEIIKAESEHLANEPNNDQRRAGINMFDQFGVMNTIKALAGGDILKYEEVLKLEYSVVFLHLRMNNTEAIFKENYSKVLRNK